MALTHLWLNDYRCFESAEFIPVGNVTVIKGANGTGKTSILEAVGLLATMRSFRGGIRESLVRIGAGSAVVRAEALNDGRRVLIEAELPVGRTARFQVNRQVTRRAADLAQGIRVSVFSPDDLALLQGPPSGRRDFLDGCLVAGDVRMEALVTEVERVLRQRAALLKNRAARFADHRGAHTGNKDGGADQSRDHQSRDHQSRGDIDSTFDVWDERLAVSGTKLVETRERLVEQLVGPAGIAYRHLAGRESHLGLSYNRSWQGELGDALKEGRADDLRHQTTGRGPHRDELLITLDEMPARTHASQGEQRCVALALRLAAHELATAKFGKSPILLLDDVFSELDDKRAALLAELLPPGQVLLATAVDPPAALSGDVVDVADVRRHEPRRSANDGAL
jgi:DNA replication and repair protein RecF